MNILLITLEYPPYHGGVANYYQNLVKYWPHPEKMHVLHNNDNHLTFSRMPLISWLPALFYLYRKIKEKKINKVIVGQIWPLGWITYLVSKATKIKYTIVLHGTLFSSAITQKRKRYLLRKILKNAESIICTNRFTVNQVENFLKSDKIISLVNPGIEIGLNNEIPESKIQDMIKKHNVQNKYILLSVGRLVGRKGFDQVIKAIPDTIKKIPHLMYVVIGVGEDEEKLKCLISENMLETRVLLLNSITNEERQIWYNLCDCFIMPARAIGSDYEGFGIVYLEANLARKPVIAGKGGGVKDVVIDGLNGISVDPENIKAISNAIVRLASDSEMRETLGTQGKKFVSENFNWRKQAMIFFSILDTHK